MTLTYSRHYVFVERTEKKSMRNCRASVDGVQELRSYYTLLDLSHGSGQQTTIAPK